MRKLLLALCLFSVPAFADGPWKVLFQDEKLPSQAALEHYLAASPLPGATTFMAPATSLGLSALTISSFASQPDYPRNITVSSAGGGVGAGSVVVNGRNVHGKTISESLSASAGFQGTLTGAKAFAALTSVVFPAGTSGSPTWSIGVGNVLGLHRCMKDAGKYAFSEFNGVYDSSRLTVLSNATHVESNTVAPVGVMDGTKPVDVFFVQNFRCFPGQ